MAIFGWVATVVLGVWAAVAAVAATFVVGGFGGRYALRREWPILAVLYVCAGVAFWLAYEHFPFNVTVKEAS